MTTWYFYPRPPRGGRLVASVLDTLDDPISIHALREEGDLVVFKPCAPPFKISIHALREEGDASLHPAMMVCNLISIHALREEGDLPTSSSAQTAVYFYPRPPRGGRLARFEFTCPACKFLSTPSARRATDGDISHYAVIEFLSTPSARRATSNNSFSIRFFLFLSTPSARRATIDQQAEIDSYLISIHALREEGDPA